MFCFLKNDFEKRTRLRRLRELDSLCNEVSSLDQMAGGHALIVASAAVQELLTVANSADLTNCPSEAELAQYRSAVGEIWRKLSDRRKQHRDRLEVAFKAVAQTYCGPTSGWSCELTRDMVTFRRLEGCFEVFWTTAGLLYSIYVMSALAEGRERYERRLAELSCAGSPATSSAVGTPSPTLTTSAAASSEPDMGILQSAKRLSQQELLAKIGLPGDFLPED